MKNQTQQNIGKVVSKIIMENPDLAEMLRKAKSTKHFVTSWKKRIIRQLREHPQAYTYYTGEERGEKSFYKLSWKDIALIRILDMLDHEGQAFKDWNLHGSKVISRPFDILRRAVQEEVFDGSYDLYEDMLHLLRQWKGTEKRKIPGKDIVSVWMGKHPSGLDTDILAMRKRNKERIMRIMQREIREKSSEQNKKSSETMTSALSTSSAPESSSAPEPSYASELLSASKQTPVPEPSSAPGSLHKGQYLFKPGMAPEEEMKQLEEWWEDDRFHLSHAVKTTDKLNRMLDYSLNEETLSIMERAEQKGIPIFITPFFLSLLLTDENMDDSKTFADIGIRQYVLYSQELVDEFGHIDAWEKEDEVVAGKPNAAGWLLPSRSIHRRYPNVAIFIPSTMGRACGGLCAYCQRMYDFQNGRFNFDLEKLKPRMSWKDELNAYMQYFEHDSQLQDILITGGDAMMSSVKSLEQILNAVYEMAKRKRRANKKRRSGEKYAELVRVRLGTKIPIYLPQRITEERCRILKDFKEKASRAGIKQFVIQTHFSTPMEVTPAAVKAVRRLIAAGWTVTNQEVFTVAASRRGHSAKLRKVLNDIGVLPYYTFTVKGYRENSSLFAVNSRSIQEQVEEKSIGRVDPKFYSEIRRFSKHAESMQTQINSMREASGVPFLATDRNTINIPGVGKSNIFRMVGITDDGRRILAFEQDHSRLHSPIVNLMNEVIIIESKSVRDYLDQLEEIGEHADDYATLWGYSIGYIETRIPVFEYPGYPFRVTSDFTNIEMPQNIKREIS